MLVCNRYNIVAVLVEFLNEAIAILTPTGNKICACGNWVSAVQCRLKANLECISTSWLCDTTVDEDGWNKKVLAYYRYNMDACQE